MSIAVQAIELGLLGIGEIVSIVTLSRMTVWQNSIRSRMQMLDVGSSYPNSAVATSMNAPEVSPYFRWFPIITFLQVGFDAWPCIEVVQFISLIVSINYEKDTAFRDKGA